MKILTIAFLTILLLTGCSSVSITNKIDIPISKSTKDFDIVGTIRLSLADGNFTYDKLLSEARKQYKDDKLDIMEIKIDKTQSSVSAIANSISNNLIVNAYVIRYK